MQRSLGLACILSPVMVGCLGGPTPTQPEVAWNVGRVDRFEIVDTKEPVDFAPIVVSDPDDVEVLSTGYRDLEWKPYLATVPVDETGYRLVGLRGDTELIRIDVGPGGSFMEGYGEQTSQLTGEAKLLFVNLVESARSGNND